MNLKWQNKPYFINYLKNWITVGTYWNIIKLRKAYYAGCCVMIGINLAKQLLCGLRPTNLFHKKNKKQNFWRSLRLLGIARKLCRFKATLLFVNQIKTKQSSKGWFLFAFISSNYSGAHSLSQHEIIMEKGINILAST